MGMSKELTGTLLGGADMLMEGGTGSLLAGGIGGLTKLLTYERDRRDRLNKERNDYELAKKSLDLTEQNMLNNKQNEGRTAGMNSLQFLANQRAGAMTNSRTLRDNLIYGR
jgi:hypothetical protein